MAEIHANTDIPSQPITACMPVVVHQNIEEGLGWRAKPVESFRETTQKIDAGKHWADDFSSVEAEAGSDY